MIKTLIKMFIPSSKTLAKYASDEIARAINSSGKEEMIAKYSKIANDITEVQSAITRILVDGKISPEETEEISARLEPLFQYLRDMI